MIRSFDEQKFQLVASSLGQGESKNAMGIIAGHAYSVIEIHEFFDDHQQVRLLKMRNPWGHSEWTGDWSDSSRLWTPELRQRF